MTSEIAFAIVVAVAFIYGVHATVFTIGNNCPFTIWPATYTGQGAQPSTGFELASGASTTIKVSGRWVGRIWARFGCTTTKGRFSCLSGDCGSGQIACNGSSGTPPATLAEFTLGFPEKNGDYFEVSVVDGYNLPVLVVTEANNGWPYSGCRRELNGICPEELAFKDPTGYVIGCKSPCLAFQQPKYCCNGRHSKCEPSKYSLFFQEQCDQAYSYPYDDDSTILFVSNGVNYNISFCNP